MHIKLISEIPPQGLCLSWKVRIPSAVLWRYWRQNYTPLEWLVSEACITSALNTITAGALNMWLRNHTASHSNIHSDLLKGPACFPPSSPPPLFPLSCLYVRPLFVKASFYKWREKAKEKQRQKALLALHSCTLAQVCLNDDSVHNNSFRSTEGTFAVLWRSDDTAAKTTSFLRF
jgi:hypothetical protein